MLRLLRLLPVLVVRLFHRRRDLLLENLVLRQQLSVLRQRRPLPRLAPADKLFWVMVLNKRHLKRLMSEYVRYYHEDRTHLALEKKTPGG